MPISPPASTALDVAHSPEPACAADNSSAQSYSYTNGIEEYRTRKEVDIYSVMKSTPSFFKTIQSSSTLRWTSNSQDRALRSKAASMQAKLDVLVAVAIT